MVVFIFLDVCSKMCNCYLRKLVAPPSYSAGGRVRSTLLKIKTNLGFIGNNYVTSIFNFFCTSQDWPRILPWGLQRPENDRRKLPRRFLIDSGHVQKNVKNHHFDDGSSFFHFAAHFIVAAKIHPGAFPDPQNDQKRWFGGSGTIQDWFWMVQKNVKNRHFWQKNLTHFEFGRGLAVIPQAWN